jgi:predicted CopG family antitoxin
MKDRTTIQIKKELRRILKSHKIYQRETYGEIIERLLKKERKIHA